MFFYLKSRKRITWGCLLGPRPMPLTLAELEAIRDDCFADDLAIPLGATKWSRDDAVQYFESGGRKEIPCRTPSLPMRFLCLHGGGANQQIMMLQTARLRRAMGAHNVHSSFSKVQRSSREYVEKALLALTGPEAKFYSWYGVENDLMVSVADDPAGYIAASPMRQSPFDMSGPMRRWIVWRATSSATAHTTGSSASHRAASWSHCSPRGFSSARVAVRAHPPRGAATSSFRASRRESGRALLRARRGALGSLRCLQWAPTTPSLRTPRRTCRPATTISSGSNTMAPMQRLLPATRLIRLQQPSGVRWDLTIDAPKWLTELSMHPSPRDHLCAAGPKE